MLEHAEPTMKKILRGELKLETPNTRQHTNRDILLNPTKKQETL